MAFKFEQLDVWQVSIEFSQQMFSLASKLPSEYRYSLADQLRRAALSIPTNIAEGCGRGGDKEQVQFYRIARGSLFETVSLLVMVYKQELIDQKAYDEHYRQADRIAAMLSGLMKPRNVPPPTSPVPRPQSPKNKL